MGYISTSLCYILDDADDAMAGRGAIRREQPSYFFSGLAMAGLLTSLSNVACSEGEQSISLMSNASDCNLIGNYSGAFHGFVYIFGSMIVRVSSIRSWFTRWNRSSTRKSPLCGRPALSIQVLSSMPVVSTTVYALPSSPSNRSFVFWAGQRKFSTCDMVTQRR